MEAVMPGRARARTALSVVLLLILGACGSTDRQDLSIAAGEKSQQEAAERREEAAERRDRKDGAASGPQGVAPDSRSGPGSVDATGRNGGGSAAGPTRPVLVGPGVTDKTIKIGMQSVDLGSTKQIQEAGGAGDFFAGYYAKSEVKVGEAIIDYINAHGGIAGRKVEPVWYEYDTANALAREAYGRDTERACATYTQDTEVFAIVSRVWDDGTLVQCARKAKAIYVHSTPFYLWVDDDLLAEYGSSFYMLNAFSAQRRDQMYVKSLVASGFLKRGTKVGILIDDFPGVRRSVEQVMKPALAATGVDVVSEAVYRDTSSPFERYTLQFQQAGATHVLFSAAGGAPSAGTFFMTAAESQAYRPRYAITTDGLPQLIAAQAPEAQAERTVGVGWAPRADQTVPEVSSRRDKLCRDIVKKSGEPNDHIPTGGIYCDGLFFLQQALKDGGDVTQDTVARSVAGLGTSFESAMQYGTRFRPGHNAAPYLVRDFAFQSSCRCFVYTSPTRGT